jgi:hypothetical protein
VSIRVLITTSLEPSPVSRVDAVLFYGSTSPNSNDGISDTSLYVQAGDPISDGLLCAAMQKDTSMLTERALLAACRCLSSEERLR